MRPMLLISVLAATSVIASSAVAHRSGCHRWHSCPSDSGSYVCGDLGYNNYCPRKPARTSVSIETVFNIQNLLIDLGYNPGPADGVIGRNTKTAITQFQRQRGLPVNGLASKALLIELKNAGN